MYVIKPVIKNLRQIKKTGRAPINLSLYRQNGLIKDKLPSSGIIILTEKGERIAKQRL